MKSRRTFLTALGAAALANALPALAQPAGKVWRVGFLPGGLLAPRKFQWDAFRQRMTELGYVEGRNVQYEIRAPDKEGASYDGLAADLVKLEVDVIVATAAVAIGAAMRATQRIPIVMCPSFDPVSEGFVVSLRRPGGNVTGVAILSEETTGKRLQLLHEMVPKASRMAFIWSTGAEKLVSAAQGAARQLGVQLQSLEVNTAEAIHVRLTHADRRPGVEAPPADESWLACGCRSGRPDVLWAERYGALPPGRGFRRKAFQGR